MEPVKVIEDSSSRLILFTKCLNLIFQFLIESSRHRLVDPFCCSPSHSTGRHCRIMARMMLLFWTTLQIFLVPYFGGDRKANVYSRHLVHSSNCWMKINSQGFDFHYIRSSLPCSVQGSIILSPEKGRGIREVEGIVGTDRIILHIGDSGGDLPSQLCLDCFVPSSSSILYTDVARVAYSEVESSEDKFGSCLQLEIRILSIKEKDHWNYSEPFTHFDNAVVCPVLLSSAGLLNRFVCLRSSFYLFQPGDSNVVYMQSSASKAFVAAIFHDFWDTIAFIRGSDWVFQRSTARTLTLFIFQWELTSGPTTIYAASTAVNSSLSPIEPAFTFWLVSMSSIERPDLRIVIVDHRQIDSLAERHILLFEASGLFPLRCAHISRFFLLAPTRSKSEEKIVSIFNFCVHYFEMLPSFSAQAKVALKFDNVQHQLGNLFQQYNSELRNARFLISSTLYRSCGCSSVTCVSIFLLNKELSFWCSPDFSILLLTHGGNHSICSTSGGAMSIEFCCAPRPTNFRVRLDPCHNFGSLEATFQAGALSWFTNFALLADQSQAVVVNVPASSCAFNPTNSYSNSTQQLSNIGTAMVVSTMPAWLSSIGIICGATPNSRVILHAIYARVARAQSEILCCSRSGSLPTSSCHDSDCQPVHAFVGSSRCRLPDHVKAVQPRVAAYRVLCSHTTAMFKFLCRQMRESENGFIFNSAVSASIASPLDLPVEVNVKNFIARFGFVAHLCKWGSSRKGRSPMCVNQSG